MKYRLGLLLFLSLFSYSCIKLKPRTESIKLSDGKFISVTIHREYNPGDFVWVLKAFTEDESFFGLACSDKTLNKVATEIWSEIEKRIDLKKMDVASVNIRNSKKQYCGFLIGKEESGEWKKLF